MHGQHGRAAPRPAERAPHPRPATPPATADGTAGAAVDTSGRLRSAQQVAQLQQLAGNRAVGALPQLQRTGQVTGALAAGSTGPSVRSLQHDLNALGAAPTLALDGIFGPKTDAAVRSFQSGHGLVPDGKVGPLTSARLRTERAAQQRRAAVLAAELTTLIAGATWPEIRKRVYPKESAAGIARAKDRKAGRLPDLTGLGRITTLEHFAAAIRAMKANWARLTVDERVAQLGRAASVELASVGVPGFLVVDKVRIEFKGFFSPTQWQFSVSQALVSGGSLTDDDAAELANTTLHECRHAEQQFLAARFSAQGKNADAIVAEQQIPKVIADQAVAAKFDARTDPTIADLGKRMFQATVTDRARNQAISDDDGLAELAVKRAEAQTAQRNVQADATAQTISRATAARTELRAQITVVEQRYTLYRNIPYEADAHEVGDAAEQAYRGWR
jgi:peptidoglycan hydrolase-like protein with peptidoglycan-binding domain